jgi:hypothetical protein
MIGMSEPTIAILEILAERPRASRAEGAVKATLPQLR